MKATEIQLQKQISEQFDKLSELIQQSEFTAGIIIIETLKETEGTLHRFTKETAPLDDKKTVVTPANVINEAMTSESNSEMSRITEEVMIKAMLQFFLKHPEKREIFTTILKSMPK